MRLANTARGLEVLLAGRLVGRLARTPQGLVAFQYDRDWLADGYSINRRKAHAADLVW